MEVKFADTFGESLKRMINRERWYWKAWDFCRYDLPRFLKNIWRFRRGLWRHRSWDYHGMLIFMEDALVHMHTNIEEHGMEVEISRMKKVTAMKRAVELLHHVNEDSFIELAEAELGEIIHHPWEFEDEPDKPGYSRLVDKDTPEEKEHNSKVFARAREIEEQEWEELWRIFKGQDMTEYSGIMDSLTDEEKRERDHYSEWFDGSNLKGWWD
jgi:hypothetical protein